MEKASEEEKAKFFLQLNDLRERLNAAEEKNQRALSMAQQTKAGNVYVISNVGSFGDDVYKIGMTRRLEPLDRIRELGDASVPFEFDVHALIYSDDAPGLERQLHRRFLKLQMNKVNPRKEFFKVGIADIKDAVTDRGISAKWTMAAEARQYRESLAITEAIKNNRKLEQEWEYFQEEAEMEIQEREVEAVE
ncbi:GIY-YIG nuclease family protein [Chryseobacterium sp. cx-311]|uniref:GIY-YIG nuclease family protein n=1 Tax=Marnyiella aurantia TaxID=2758037 RepID=UPI001AE4D667|nr:GIY-YIG nuclease family protein [Marnyiella aurantia]MBP0613933.1 GIY-YIG nuclease family protein [Marnyiella aurantia]